MTILIIAACLQRPHTYATHSFAAFPLLYRHTGRARQVQGRAAAGTFFVAAEKAVARGARAKGGEGKQ